MWVFCTPRKLELMTKSFHVKSFNYNCKNEECSQAESTSMVSFSNYSTIIEEVPATLLNNHKLSQHLCRDVLLPNHEQLLGLREKVALGPQSAHILRLIKHRSKKKRVARHM